MKDLWWSGLILVLAACSPLATNEAADLEELRVEDQAEPQAPPQAEEAPGQSFAGTVAAPELPANLDWLNTDRPLSLAELRGKLVLLDFWTYGCINCMHNFPGLKQLEAEYADELVVIGVHSAKFENEGDTDNIRQIILRYDLEHPVVNDHEFNVWNTWGVRAWPTLVLIDPRGNVAGGHSGEGVYPVFKPVIESLVQEFDELDLLDRSPLGLKLEKEGLPSTVLSFPGKILADPAAGRLFVADTNHHRIVVADIQTGEVQAVYGTGEVGWVDGEGATAQFYNPQGMALDDDTLYVADVDNHAVRTIDLQTGKVATLIGTGEQARSYPPSPGTAPQVELNSPWDLALERNNLYIAMAGSHQIWRLDLSNGEMRPLAGNGRESTLNGASLEAELAQPSGLAIHSDGRLYFADAESSSIRWADLTGTSPEVGTLAGSDKSLFQFGDLDGVGTSALLQHPLGIVSDGEVLYIADTYNSKIRRIDPSSGEVTTFLGDDHGWRDGPEPLFYEPGGLDLEGEKLYVADTNNHAIRVVDLGSGKTSTLVLSGIENFVTMDGGFAGSLVSLEPVRVAPGSGTVVLNVELPEGYKFNDLAPSSIEWVTAGDVVRLPSEANVSVSGPSFPMELAVQFGQGSGSLEAELALYYCEVETEALCLYEQVLLRLPLETGVGEDSVAELTYAIPAPDLATG